MFYFYVLVMQQMLIYSQCLLFCKFIYICSLSCRQSVLKFLSLVILDVTHSKALLSLRIDYVISPELFCLHRIITRELLRAVVHNIFFTENAQSSSYICGTSISMSVIFTCIKKVYINAKRPWRSN